MSAVSGVSRRVEGLEYTALAGYSKAWKEITCGIPVDFHGYARSPADWAASREAATEQLKVERPWSELAGVLSRSSQYYGVPGTVLDRLSFLAEGKAVAVVTGQQVGYLGGPLYTFVKALHAIRLAAELERRWGLPVLPVFWLEGEDHDFEEIREAGYLDGNGDLQKFRLSPEREIPNRLAGNYRADAAGDLITFREQLGQVDERALDLLRECYDGGTLSDAMGRLLGRTLGPHGLLVIEGMDRGLKSLAAPLWERVTALGRRLSDILHERTAEIESAGYPAPIHPTPGAHLFYLIDDDGCRVPLNYGGEAVLSAQRKSVVAAGSLSTFVRAEPWRVSPKAALRPLYQDFALPTAAYVAGPGEMSYHMQVAPFYRELGVVAPSLFPRLSVTIEDGRTARQREKLNLPVIRMLSEPAVELRKSLVRETDESHAAELFSGAKQEIERLYERIKPLVQAIDPTLAGLATSSAGKSLQPLEQLRDKTEKALRQKHAATLAKLDRVLNTLHPGGRSAERVLCTGYYLARFGADRIIAALRDLPLEPMRHWVITLDA